MRAARADVGPGTAQNDTNGRALVAGASPGVFMAGIVSYGRTAHVALGCMMSLAAVCDAPALPPASPRLV